MPGRYTKQGEIQQMQYELANEVHKDAQHIAQGVFGDTARMPDMGYVSNQQFDQLLRQKYTEGDRQWLQAEARRDPQQFLDAANRIGVQLPPPGPDGQPVMPPDQNALAKQLAASAQAQQAPVPAPSPVLPPPPMMPPPMLQAPVAPVAPVVVPPVPPPGAIVAAPPLVGPQPG